MKIRRSFSPADADAVRLEALWRRFFILLFVVIALHVSGILIVIELSRGDQYHAELINLSGRQRMLSQRMMYFATRMAGGDEVLDADAIKSEIGATLSELKAAQAELLQKLQLSSGLFFDSEYIERILLAPPYEAGPKLAEFIETADSFLTGALGKKTLYREWGIQEEVLLNSLDFMTSTIQNESKFHTIVKNSIIYGMYAISILLVICFSFFLLLPVARRLKASISTINAANVRFNAIFESSIASIVVAANADGNIVLWNSAAADCFGYTFDEIIGQPLLKLIPDRFREAHGKGFTRAIAAGEVGTPRDPSRFVGLRKDGTEFPIEISRNVWIEGNDVVFGAIARDISEPVAAENKLLSAKSEAERANKAKSDFLASMSHELRTPLNAILGYGQMLQLTTGEKLTESETEYITHILEGGSHLLTVINDLLDLARIEADRVVINLESFGATSIIFECMESLKGMANQKSLSMNWRHLPSALPDIWCDKVRFRQILLNLISNAIKYNKEGGFIDMDARVTSDMYLHVSIVDSGIGIPKEKQKDIFTMFHRAQNAEIAADGTGIGLAVSKMLTERLGGRIGFASQVGEGSRFWFEIPLAANDGVMIWTDDLRIGVDSIDKEHQLLFTLTNYIAQYDLNDAEIKEALNELLILTREHFRNEEEVMSMAQYPELKGHCRIHTVLLKQISTIVDGYIASDEKLSLPDIRRLLSDKWLKHIWEDDMKFSKWMSGREPNLHRSDASEKQWA